MALKLFVGFDCNLIAGQTTAPTTWENTCKPQGVYNISGVLAQDQNVPTSSSFVNIQSGRHTNSSAWGTLDSGHEIYFLDEMVSVNRGVHSIGAEVWITADIKIGSNNVNRVNTSTANPNDRSWVFRWGDLGVCVKSLTWNAGTPTTFTAVFSVRNNGTEVATVTVPNITPITVTGTGARESSPWLYMNIHAKLDGSTGLIDVNIGGYAQSVAYTGQNTVTTYALASTGTLYTADYIHVGPPDAYYPAFYFGQNYLFTGAIDNLALFDTGFPVGRPNGFRSGTGTSETSSGWSAVGTSPSTLRDALSTPTDAKAARGDVVGSSAILDLDGSLSGTGFNSDILGVNIFLKKVAKRQMTDVRVTAGLSTSGVHTMGTQASAVVLSYDAPSPPPNTIFRKAGVWEGIYENGLTFSNLSSTGVRLVVS